jgi:hypothetical protein
MWLLVVFAIGSLIWIVVFHQYAGVPIVILGPYVAFKLHQARGRAELHRRRRR